MYGPWNIWNHPIVDENWIAIRCYQPQAHITSDASQVQFPHFGTLGTKMVIVQVGTCWHLLNLGPDQIDHLVLGLLRRSGCLWVVRHRLDDLTARLESR